MPTRQRSRNTNRIARVPAPAPAPKQRTFSNGLNIAPVSMHSAAIARGEYLTEDGERRDVKVEIFREKGTLVLDIGLTEGEKEADKDSSWLCDPVTVEQIVQLQKCLTVAVAEARAIGLLPPEA